MKVAVRATIIFLALAMLAAASSGCAVQPRKVMFKQEFVQDKSVRHIKDPVTEEYILQICEYDDQGSRQTCSESTIMVEREKEDLL